MKSYFSLRSFLVQRNIKHEFYEFEDVSYFSSVSKINIDIDKIFKTILFIGDNNPIPILINIKYKVKQNELRKILGLKNLRLANDEEIIRYTGYEPGGISPIDLDLEILIDKEIMNYDYIIVGGGDKKHLLKIYKEDLLKNTRNKILDIPKILRSE